MKQYKDYLIEDFLLDDDFVQWVQAGCPQKNTLWTDLIAAYPHKKATLESARNLIVQEQQTTLSGAELTEEVRRILASTAKDDQVVVRPLTGRRMWWYAAASLLVVLGASLVVWRNQAQVPAYSYAQLTKTSSLTLVEVNNTDSTTRHVALPDGSEVTLEANSRISYASRFTSQPSRTVFLQGNAFFEVTKNPKQPFLVYANGLVTRVVGTSFSVKSSGDNVSVVVKSGKVAVYSMEDVNPVHGPSKRLLLTPNQQATFLADQNKLTQSIVANPIVLHESPKVISFVFDDTPISEVFSRLQRMYGLPIEYDAVAMKNCSLTVTLRDEPFFTKLDVICRTIGASYQIQGSKIIITSAGCE